jgi:hypothetical protein
MCHDSWLRVLGDVLWVTPLSSGTKEAVLGKGNRIMNRLNDFPYSNFVIIAQGETLYPRTVCACRTIHSRL